MNKCKLVIKDQCNVKFNDLDPVVRRKMVEALEFMVPWARHTPTFKLGRWNGKVSFSNVGGSTYLNLIENVLPIILDAGYEIDIEDHRKEYNFSFPTVDKNIISHITWPVGHPKAGEAIILNDHQVVAINKYLENQQSLQSLSTSAGKTIITSVLSMAVEKYGRTIVIVPNKSLVAQTEEDYKNVGLDCGVYYGDRKELGHTHTICTWQSLSVLHKKQKKGEIVEFPLSEFIKDVVCVIVDEVHSLNGEQLRQLMTGPFADIPIRWGMTGTIPKEPYEFYNLLLAVGPVVNTVGAAELQEKGILANCHIDILQLKDDHVEFKNYQEESKYLTTDQNRLHWVSSKILNISETGNTLVLVNNVATGKLLHSLIPNSVFLSGKDSVDNRKKEYKEIQNIDNKVLICTYGIASTGISINRLFNLILFEPGKSFVRVIQSIGRGLRIAEDKDHVNIYDVTSNLKYSARHLTKRKSYYKEAEYPFSVTKIDYLRNL